MSSIMTTKTASSGIALLLVLCCLQACAVDAPDTGGPEGDPQMQSQDLSAPTMVCLPYLGKATFHCGAAIVCVTPHIAEGVHAVLHKNPGKFPQIMSEVGKCLGNFDTTGPDLGECIPAVTETFHCFMRTGFRNTKEVLQRAQSALGK
jgi:hypothetical protein